jgi:HD-like signal output (HDOD) protein
VSTEGAAAQVERADLESTSATIAAYLLEHFASPSYTPPLLPAVAVEVHNLAHKPNVDVARVVSVLEKDPLLAGRVLKVSQSALYARRDPPKSLSEAVVHIGMRELSNVLWEVAFTMRVLRVARYAAVTEAVVQHSSQCARLTRLVCSSAGVKSDYGFLCGLLHDVGITASLGVLAEHADASKGPLAGHKAIPDVLIGHTLRRCHEQATRAVVRLWKLPDEVLSVVGYHHSVQGELSPVLAGLIVAEGLAASLDGGAWEATAGGVESADPVLFGRAQAALKLSEENMAVLREEARILLAVPPLPGSTKEAAAPVAPARTTQSQPVVARAVQPGQQKTAQKPRRWYHFLFR